MQLALMRNYYFLSAILIQISVTALEYSASVPSILADRTSERIISPPKLTINNTSVFAHDMNDTKTEITICRNTLFAMAQLASLHIPAKSSIPHGPVIGFNHQLTSYDKNGIELIDDHTRFDEKRNDGWHYYVFTTKGYKGKFVLSFHPTFAHSKREEKTITIIIT